MQINNNNASLSKKCAVKPKECGANHFLHISHMSGGNEIWTEERGDNHKADKYSYSKVFTRGPPGTGETMAELFIGRWDSSVPMTMTMKMPRTQLPNDTHIS